MSLPAVLLSGLTGSLTGYVTNDVAVRMLFRSFGPFGGVLESTREEFIFNMSQLVEDEIINYETISGELESEEVREEINNFISSVISSRLPEQFSGVTWNEVPEWQDTGDGLRNLLMDEELFEDLLENIGENIYCSEVASREQLNYVISRLLESGVEALNEEHFSGALAELLAGLISSLHNPEKSPGMIKKQLKDLQSSLSERENEVKMHLEKLLKALDVDSIAAEEIEKLLNQPPLKWWRSPDTPFSDGDYSGLASDISFQKIKDLLGNFLRRDEGKQLVRDVVSAAFSALKEIDLTLPELLGENWRALVLPLMEDHLPELLEEIFCWLDENREELEQLIDDAIGEVLQEGSGLRNQLKSILFRALQGNVARRYGLLERLLRRLETEEDTQQLAQNMTGRLAELLENKTVGWLFAQLDGMNIADWKLFHQLLLKILDEDPPDFSGENSFLLNAVPADFLDAKGISREIGSLIPSLFADILTGLLLDDRSRSALSGIVNEMVCFFHSTSTGRDYLQSALSSLNRKKILPDSLPDLSSALAGSLSGFLSRHTCSFLLTPNIKNEITGLIQEKGDIILREMIKKKSGACVDDLFREIQKIPNYQERISDFALELLEDNLSLLMEDRVSQAVSDNLLTLSAEDMRRIVENFMGRELRPLTYFGGFLGLLAGILLEAAGGNYMAAAGGPASLFLSMGVYGFVGFLTNVLAIKMIFRPYEPITIAGFKLPFTPGLISRNKERFAGTLGDFVEKDLLDPHRLSRLLRENRESLAETLNEELMSDDYRSLRVLLRVSSKNFAGRLIEIMCSWLRNNSRTAADWLSGAVEDVLHKEDIFKKGGEMLEREMLQHEETFIEAAARIAARTSKIESSLMHMLPYSPGSIFADRDEGRRDNAGNEEEQDKYAENIISPAGELIRELQKKQTADPAEFLEELDYVKPADFISPSRRIMLEKFMADNTIDFFQGEGFYDFWRRLNEKKPGKSLPGEILELLPSLVKKNVSSLLDIFLERILAFLDSERDRLKEMVADAVEEELKKTRSDEGILGGLIIRGAYRFTDGRATLDNLIDIILDEKLPDYLQRSRQELGERIQPLLVESGREISPQLIEISSPDGWAEVAADVANRPEVETNLRRFIERFSRTLWQVEFKPAAFLQNGGEIISSVKGEEDLWSQLIDNYKHNHRSADEEIKNLLQIGGWAFLLNSSPRNIIQCLMGMEDTGFNQIFDLLSVNQGELMSGVRDLIMAVTGYADQEKEWENPPISCDLLVRDIQILISGLEGREDLISDMEKSLSSYIQRTSARLPREIQQETARYFLENLTSAGLEGLEIHFQSLLESVAVKDVAVEQVEAMDPAAVEALFDSFAGRYLNRLKLYGWSGSFFGLLASLITGI